MTDSTRDMLKAQAEAARDTLILAKAHLDGYYDEDGAAGDGMDHDIEACDICSQYSPGTEVDAAQEFLDEYPLEIVRKVGTLLAVVISTGGPHVAIEQDVVWDQSARLQCYWGGESYTLRDPIFTWALDYYIPEDDQ